MRDKIPVDKTKHCFITIDEMQLSLGSLYMHVPLQGPNIFQIFHTRVPKILKISIQGSPKFWKFPYKGYTFWPFLRNIDIYGFDFKQSFHTRVIDFLVFLKREKIHVCILPVIWIFHTRVKYFSTKFPFTSKMAKNWSLKRHFPYKGPRK